MGKSKTVVTRKCVSCGKIIDKAELLRIVKDRSGKIALDPCGHMEGRGAYLCRASECIEKAEKKNSFERSFRTRIDRQDKDRIFEEIRKLASG